MLIGFMGAGKTTVSRELSQMTGMKELDMDAYIVEREGMSIADMFEKFGEEYFRKKETESLVEIMKVCFPEYLSGLITWNMVGGG